MVGIDLRPPWLLKSFPRPPLRKFKHKVERGAQNILVQPSTVVQPLLGEEGQKAD
jgi:hypothetical protein